MTLLFGIFLVLKNSFVLIPNDASYAASLAHRLRDGGFVRRVVFPTCCRGVGITPVVTCVPARTDSCFANAAVNAQATDVERGCCFQRPPTGVLPPELG